jgi:nitrite reductase (NADH) small subunit
MARKLVRQGTWVPVCRVDRLTLDVGVAALVGGEQVALFRLDVEQIRAIGNLDPYSQAQVLSRGIVGSRGEAVFVASPMYKQPFDLRTGQCLDDPAVSVPTFEVRVVDGVVQVLAPPPPAAGNRAAGNSAAGSRGRPPDE